MLKYWQLMVYLGSLMVGVGITLGAVQQGKDAQRKMEVRIERLEEDRQVLVRIDERTKNIVERLDRIERVGDVRNAKVEQRNLKYE